MVNLEPRGAQTRSSPPVPPPRRSEDIGNRDERQPGSIAEDFSRRSRSGVLLSRLWLQSLGNAGEWAGPDSPSLAAPPTVLGRAQARTVVHRAPAFPLNQDSPAATPDVFETALDTEWEPVSNARASQNLATIRDRPQPARSR